MTFDPYALSAEFYDVISEEQWQLREARMAAALSEAPADQAPVLDVGAGTGPCVRLIADALPKARIIAVEPSAAMRAALACRIMQDVDLRQRVTVLAGRLQDVVVPPNLSAAVICGTIGYFDKSERLALWADLAERLVSGGLIIVDVMMLSEPQEIPYTKIAGTTIGEQALEVWMEGSPADQDVMRWKMTYKVMSEETVLRTFCDEHDWHTFGLDQVAEEASQSGFSFEPLADAMIPAGLLRRR